MKFFAILIIALFASAEAYQEVKTRGQGTIKDVLLTWTTGANTGKTRLRFLGNAVYLDTSATGQAGAWKRIDNTADSCSQPAFLASDTAALGLPVWQSPLVWVDKAKSADPDSSTFVLRIQTRQARFHPASKRWYWTAWTRKGANSAHVGQVVQDSVLFSSLVGGAANTNYSLYHLASVFGTQARYCPDDVEGTANGTNDSIIVDSVWSQTR